MNEPRRVTRRQALRKGAVVGGNLLWIAPAIQTLAPKALAHLAAGSPVSACCECREGQPNRSKCNGSGGLVCVEGFSGTVTDCMQICAAMENNGKSYCFHESPTPISCVGSRCESH